MNEQRKSLFKRIKYNRVTFINILFYVIYYVLNKIINQWLKSKNEFWSLKKKKKKKNKKKKKKKKKKLESEKSEKKCLNFFEYDLFCKC